MKHKFHLVAITAAILLMDAAQASNVTIPHEFSSGTPARAAEVNANFAAVKSAVDDNDARITQNAADIAANTAAIANTGLLGYDVLIPTHCWSFTEATTSFSKILDVGTFSKLSSTSTMEIQFNGRLVAHGIGGVGVVYELRVDDAATTLGFARALLRQFEQGPEGVNASITGLFPWLYEGSHTVSLWAATTDSTASFVGLAGDTLCQTNHFVVKELE